MMMGNVMGMSINLTPEQEKIVADELKSGQYQNAQQVIGRALQALRERGGRAAIAEPREAVAAMTKFIEANAVSLDGISVRELIHEGHRW